MLCWAGGPGETLAGCAPGSRRSCYAPLNSATRADAGRAARGPRFRTSTCARTAIYRSALGGVGDGADAMVPRTKLARPRGPRHT